MRIARSAACTPILVLAVAACGVTPGPHAPPVDLHSRPAPASVFAMIADPAEAGVPDQVRALLRATGRPGEHVFVIDASSGAVLDASTAPPEPRLRLPGAPELPGNPTDFQRGVYRHAMSRYRVIVRLDRARLRLRQRRELSAWAATVARAVARARSLHPAERAEASLGRALNAAAAQLSSLLQAGLSFGPRKVVAVLGIGAMAASTPPGLPGGLQGITMVVAGFPGDGDAEAAWQASLVQAHAARVVMLTPASGGQLPAVVAEGLDGAIAITFTRVLFAPGRHELLAAGAPRLRRLLRLLAVRYRQGTVVIDGYTDDLPVRGGNLRLSRERAAAVEAWLAAHGIAASRMQAFGYGAADPVAPNRSGGQPLDRRVVVIIDPAGQVPPA